MTVPTGWAAVPSPRPVGMEARPASPTSAAGRPVGRPAPQYGEYAPEGWVNPVLAEAERREREAAERAQSTGAAPSGRTPLGPQGAWRTEGAPPVRADAARTRQRPRDALITGLLFLIGLWSVVPGLTNVTGVAAQVASTIAAKYTTLSDPSALVTAAAWCGVGQAVLFVLAVWWAVVRIRRRKVSFWIPIAAGFVATAASGAVYFAVILHDPQFAAWFATHAASAG